ncbi:hypothetical protein ACP26L_36140 (plasmid) [Paenibacillus sp. S-38]|uniref:hypothetical protein n=1 Tax=Paenibacillus sp. S-38 TaxID=3416710 RepID=UPI003CF83E21
MNALRIMLIGQNLPIDYQADDRLAWLIYSPSLESQLTDIENYLTNKKAVETADMLVLNVQHGDPSFDEGVFLHLAYSKQIPIFLIGDCLSSKMIHAFESNAFLDFNQTLQHIVDFYL